VRDRYRHRERERERIGKETVQNREERSIQSQIARGKWRWQRTTPRQIDQIQPAAQGRRAAGPCTGTLSCWDPGWREETEWDGEDGMKER
jgi:hypothetical protein